MYELLKPLAFGFGIMLGVLVTVSTADALDLNKTAELTARSVHACNKGNTEACSAVKEVASALRQQKMLDALIIEMNRQTGREVR